MPTYAVNKKIGFDYEILDTLEAGLVLTGQEVKSVRHGGVRLHGGFITFHKGRPILTNVHIPIYTHASSAKDYDPERPRELLLHKKEIGKIQGKIEEKGLTMVPVSLYTSRSHIKLKIAIVKGKKTYDKRRTIKEREQKREVERSLKQHS